MSCEKKSKPDYDVILFGAAGYTGKLVAEYLARVARARRSKLRWAIAGRNQGKLEAVRRDLAAIDGSLASLPIVIADSVDQASLDALAASTRVVATTVGPFAKYGRGLAATCARQGTHYCDITGEMPFVRASIDASHAIATQSSAKIVHACGFDAVPSDLGAYLLFDRARALGRNLKWAKGFAVEVKGRFSGGTFNTILGTVDEAVRRKGTRRLLLNPYALNPDPQTSLPKVTDQRTVRFDRDAGGWTAPFLMSVFNTRIVRRTSALLGYGGTANDFRYDEVMSFPPGPKGFAMASAVTAGIAGFFVATAIPVTRNLLARSVLPKPGEGPTKEERDRGSFKFRFVGETSKTSECSDGRASHRLEAVVSIKLDPGYGTTALMLGESALCLAEDGEALPKSAGVLTPAAAMGGCLVTRLRRAGMTLEVV
ncbi:MAG: saccharopine dehydrogenase NADP-binding domain-containing protein [Polyangiaceae bacterium]|nr:saccharopine dehydrogenase NADP-binding domain-containing protein [Polyangiaceae bacterium]